jgi:hypothetical protein
MNDTHLEQPDLAMGFKDALDEITEAVRELDTEQELRLTALQLAIQVYLKPGEHRYNDVLSLAEGFYKFLSSDELDD